MQKKILEEINRLFKFKNNKTKFLLQYLESILNYNQNNNVESENVIFIHIKTSKKKPDITYDYYTLAKCSMKKNDTKNEKKYLEKVIEFGNDTFMAKDAKKRLKKL